MPSRHRVPSRAVLMPSRAEPSGRDAQDRDGWGQRTVVYRRPAAATGGRTRPAGRGYRDRKMIPMIRYNGRCCLRRIRALSRHGSDRPRRTPRYCKKAGGITMPPPDLHQIATGSPPICLRLPSDRHRITIGSPSGRAIRLPSDHHRTAIGPGHQIAIGPGHQTAIGPPPDRHRTAIGSPSGRAIRLPLDHHY